MPEPENQAREGWTDRQARPPACRKWGSARAWYGFVRQARGLPLRLLSVHGKAVTEQLLFGEAGEASDSPPAAEDDRVSGRRVGPGGLGFRAASPGGGGADGG